MARRHKKQPVAAKTVETKRAGPKPRKKRALRKRQAHEQVAIPVPALKAPAARLVEEIRFCLKPRELAVVKFLLPFPGEACFSGEVPWTEVIRALDRIGFDHSDNSGGSSNDFWPKDDGPLQGNHKITFHAPHDGRFRFREARKFGRQLANTYGLDASMFAQS